MSDKYKFFSGDDFFRMADKILTSPWDTRSGSIEGSLKDEGSNLVLTLEIPGFEKQDVTVSIEDKTLIVIGDNHLGKFTQKYTLNDRFYASDVTAELKAGILRVVIPRMKSNPIDVIKVPVK